VAVGDIRVYINKISGDFDSDAAIYTAAGAYAAEKGTGFRKELVLSRDDLGKPYFAAIPQLHFSVSHSGDYWLCAFAALPCGIDIQKHVSCQMGALARRFFHEEEYRWLEISGYENFFAVWTAKESYVKYTGQGIDDNFGGFSVIAKNGIAGEVNGAQVRFLPFYPGYTVCLCAENIALVELSLFDQQNRRYQIAKFCDIPIPPDQ
jgi:4'-phosphopantetheinyl transferase